VCVFVRARACVGVRLRACVCWRTLSTEIIFLSCISICNF
jgi:hypothetical protein